MSARNVRTPFLFSPRKRRCFSSFTSSPVERSVFSAQAEVFLIHRSLRSLWKSFLRASGGVSIDFDIAPIMSEFSPRKRRCFFHCLHIRLFWRVFSAQAEVFLTRNFISSVGFCFLRASGGVSIVRGGIHREERFSPRKRRCFWWSKYYADSAQVFSAQAEVFLIQSFLFFL